MEDNKVYELIQYNVEFAAKLADICKPLFQNFGVTSFAYNKIYENGKRVILETNKEWLEYYGKVGFQEKNYGSNSMVHQVSNLLHNTNSQGYHIHMLSGKPNNKLHEFLVEIDLWNCLSIYVRMNKCVEAFHLAAPRNNDIIAEFCLNKRELIQRFIHYFREKIYDIINIDNAPYVLNEDFAALFNKAPTMPIPDDNKNDHQIKEYIEQTNFHKFYLKTHEKFITKREAECLHYMALGKSFKEIARILEISPRTVEPHINMLKEKTSCTSKSELINIGHKNNINSLNYFVLFNIDNEAKTI